MKGKRRIMVEGLTAAALHPVVLIAIGGGLGAVCRYWLGVAVDGRHWHGGLPWGTLIINVLGSFILGFVAIYTLKRLDVEHRELFLLLGPGFCGGFTTFSTFEWDIFRLVEDEKWPTAVWYILASLFAGFLAMSAGVWLALLLFTRQR